MVRTVFRQLVVLVLALSICVRADAQALPAFTGAVNKVIGKVIEKTGLRRGFAANDPRFGTTVAVVGTAATVAADVAIGAAAAASAPVWLSVAAGLGAAAVVGGLAYGAYRLFFDDASSKAKFVVKKPGEGSGVTPPAPTIIPEKVTDTTYKYTSPPAAGIGGREVYSAPDFKMDSVGVPISTTQPYYVKPSYIAGIYVSCNTTTQCLQMAMDYYVREGAVLNQSAYGSSAWKCDPMIFSSDGQPYYQSCMFQYKFPWSANWNVGTGAFDFVRNPYYQTPPVTVSGSIEQIVAQLPESELAKEADPETIAMLANNLWQRAAAQPDYQGIPYSASDPVTVEDARAVQQANPAAWPRNADLVSPVAQAANQPVPIGDVAPAPDPGTDPGTDPTPEPGGLTNVNVMNTPNVRVVNKVEVDFGEGPTVATPGLEDTPTAQQILAPITSLMPTLKSFVVPGHTSTCPTASFTAFDQAVVIDGQCELFETIRPTLYAVMAFVWLALGAMIVLRA